MSPAEARLQRQLDAVRKIVYAHPDTDLRRKVSDALDEAGRVRVEIAAEYSMWYGRRGVIIGERELGGGAAELTLKVKVEGYHSPIWFSRQELKHV